MPVKEQRLETHVTDSQKELFKRAAAIQELSLADFMVSSLTERATQVVKDHEIIVLSKEDSRIFVEAFLNPPKPNAKMRKAAQEHRKVFG